MMTTTKFTNNVLRAKAVKVANPKFGGSKPKKSLVGASAKGGRGGMGQAATFGGSKSPVQTPKTAGY